jgi:transposase
MAAMYVAGASLRQIAMLFGIQIATVQRHISTQLPYKLRMQLAAERTGKPTRVSYEDAETMLEWAESNMTKVFQLDVEEIAKEMAAYLEADRQLTAMEGLPQ